MRRKKSAFTLVEVLISITLLSLVLMALYKSADILRDSNLHLFKYLQKSSQTLKGSKTLYADLVHSDHNITITKEEKLHRLIIRNTSHSLYGQAHAQVVWMIHKEDKTLLRLEGGAYNIPLKNEQHVHVDTIAKNIELFKIYKSKKKDKVLVLIQIKGQEAQIFMAQNIPLKPPKPKKNKNNVNPTSSPK